jgi:rhodanese-related sulfurtransferase
MRAPTASPAHTIERIARREDTCQVPQPVLDRPGILTVDATWGMISPIKLAPGVSTVGELEVIDHIAAGLPLVDTRLEHFFRDGTIPAARNIPHEQIGGSINSLDSDVATIFFCNGPQCAATPDAIRTLLKNDYPAESILYYRGGLHDWMTLGLPIESRG